MSRIGRVYKGVSVLLKFVQEANMGLQQRFVTGVLGDLGSYYDTPKSFGIKVDIDYGLFVSIWEAYGRPKNFSELVTTINFSEIPDNILIQKRAVYNEDVIPGRTEPWLNYSHSEGTIVTFTAKLFAQGQKKEGWNSNGMLGGALGMGARFYSPSAPFLGIGGNVLSMLMGDDPVGPTSDIFKEVHQKAALLQSLTYARYNAQGIAYPPLKVWLVINSVNIMYGVIKEVNLTHKGPYDTNSLMSYLIECYVVFQESNARPKGFADVLLNKAPTMGGTEFDWARAGKSALGTGRSIMGI